MLVRAILLGALLSIGSTAAVADECSELRAKIKEDQEFIANTKKIVLREQETVRTEGSRVDALLAKAKNSQEDLARYRDAAEKYKISLHDYNISILVDKRNISEREGEVSAAQVLLKDLACPPESQKLPATHCDAVTAQEAMADLEAALVRIYPGGVPTQKEYDWKLATVDKKMDAARDAIRRKDYDGACKIYRDLMPVVEEHGRSMK